MDLEKYEKLAMMTIMMPQWIRSQDWAYSMTYWHICMHWKTWWMGSMCIMDSLIQSWVRWHPNHYSMPWSILIPAWQKCALSCEIKASSTLSQRVDKGLVNETVGPIGPKSVEFNNCVPEITIEVFVVHGKFGLRRISWGSSTSNFLANGMNGLSWDSAIL